ncbi:hypothetical protein V5F53_13690 [Xanthobacter sp. V4C-4]|uniref:hypothetical protein n=1 Tax=Xanthobacter cornucopiae TaxID=3119924 RepID=UPI00372C1611
MAVDFSRPLQTWLPTATYPGFRFGLPDMVLGQLPEPVSIAVGRAYKGWIIETEAERGALEAALSRPIPQPEPGRLHFKSGPDAACAAPSQGPPFVALYVPPRGGWPFLVLSAWPPDPERRIRIQRDRYVWEAFAQEGDARAELERLAAALPLAPVFIQAG